MLKFYLRTYLVPGIILFIIWLKVGPPAMQALSDLGIITRKGRIAFASNRTGNWEIYVMKPDGTRVRRLTRTNDIDETSPAWSPDGKWIAFVGSTATSADIEVMRSNGRGRVKLTMDDAREADPAWSPDGTLIAFTSYRYKQSEIYVIDSDGSNPRRLTNNTADDRYPQWKPGTNIIYFMRTLPITKKAVCQMERVVALRADDGSEAQFNDKLSKLDNIPTWSPKGDKLAFSGKADLTEKRGVIYTLLNGSNILEQVTFRGDEEFDENPTWSPDGKRIAFTRRVMYEHKARDIYIVDLTRHITRNLTEGSGDNDYPDWY